jgi:hypothetical protein
VFTNNYKRIIDHNAIPDSGFELEVNMFADLTDEEFIRGYTGLRVPAWKTEAFKNLSVPLEDEEE